jgi:kojibiose phosphorylase
MLIERGFDPRTFKAWEGLFTLGAPGTPGLHIRGSLEEPVAGAPQNEEYDRVPANVTSEVMRHPVSKWGTYVPGVYGRHPVLGLQLINLPWFLWLVPKVDGERLDVERCEILEHHRQLDLRNAILSRSLRWRTRSETIVHVDYERFVSAAEPGACVQTMTVRCHRACELIVESGIDADVRTNGIDHFKGVEWGGTDRELACAVVTDRDDQVMTRSALAAMRDPRIERRVEGRRAWIEVPIDVSAEEVIAIVKRTDVRRLQEARALTPTSSLRQPSEIRDRHKAAWAERWRSADIEIEGDPESQRAIRTAVFHLLRAHPGAASGLAIDAKGYAGEAYWGRFFWDTEIYLLPFYLHTNPALAKALLEFRVRTLPAAMENAKARGFQGAKYPWEAGPDGTEECPNAIYADQELHITADVVYAIAHYVAATGDNAFLTPADVQDVLLETARYWTSRTEWIDGAPHLRRVMGPDEYTPDCEDNAYTNMMAGCAMAFALEHARRRFPPADRRACGDAANLPIHRHPDDPELILQCKDFHRLDEVDFTRIWKDRSRTLAGQVPLEDLYRAKVLKQADVVLLLYLYENHFTVEERRRAWDYYLPLTTHDSSLSPATHALFAARNGLPADAWSYWRRACALDLDVERGGAAEGIHIANCGMLWHTVVHGFAGISSAMHTDILTLTPRLPAQWRLLRFPLQWRGDRFFIELTPKDVRIRNDGPRHMVRAVVNDSAQHIPLDATVCWSCP